MQWKLLAVSLAIASILYGGTIHLKSRDVETQPDRGVAPGSILKRRTFGKSHYLLQFDGPVGQDRLRELAARGATVTSAVPDSALMVAAGDDFSTDGLGIEWAGRLRSADKLSSTLMEDASSGPGVFIVEFHSDMDMDDARQMVGEQNLQILAHDNLLSDQLLVLGAVETVSQLAEWDEVAYIFPASDDLIAGNEVIACEGALTGQGTIAQYVKVGHGWSPEGSNGVQIKYFFDELTSRVPALTTKAEIARAFKEWSKYANVSFVPGDGPQAPRTVRVLFARGDHGDPFPFQAQGATLAHTFYPAPPNAESLAGDMHLNDDENWHSGANIDIFTVALHETGHALGLGHSDKPGAIMYPYYRLGAGISADDIAGVQDLYGVPVAPTTAPAVESTPVTAIPTGPSPVLTLSVQSPSDGTVETPAATVLVAGIVSGASGNAKVAWQTDHGNTGTTTPTAGTGLSPANWSIPAVPLAVGKNTLTLTATDAAHHNAVSTLIVTRKTATAAPASTTPPGIVVTAPSVTITSTNLPTITVRGVASDITGVVRVTWQNALGGSQGAATGTDEWTATNIPLYPGTNNLILRAFNTSGNSSWRSLTVIRR